MSNYNIHEVMEWFNEVPNDEQAEYKIIAATYDQGGYDGDAFVLMENNGKLLEVHGSHCSCYGLEGLWDEEETTIESLKYRMDKGYNYGAFANCIPEIKEYLINLETNEE